MARNFHAAMTLALALLGLASVAAAQDSGEREVDRPRGGVELTDAQRRFLLQRFDRNRDGRLDEAERRTAMMQRGRMTAGMRSRSAAPATGMSTSTPRLLVALTERFDADGNGVLDAGEIATAERQLQSLERVVGSVQAANRPGITMLVRRFDKNGDRRLTGAEVAAMQASLKQALAFAARLNPAASDAGRPTTAANGSRTRPSPTVPQAVLDRFDANKNGRLDPAELTKAREAFARRRGGPGGALGGSLLDESGVEKPALLDVSPALAKFDADGDGRLSPAERRQALTTAK